ncbi:hypothetical protein [Haloarcula sp. CBA1127]|uniref:hypothetical protein n=1 Tax=Haloarcula sp. CBA1127 TaxID=1765055 RepID=UPI000A40971A|nr:hypothetical protein [Haloarcula sp. CBA1127]
MIETSLTPNRKGSVGEALIFGGRRVPRPVKEAIQSYIKKQHDVAEEVPVKVSARRGAYFEMITAEGETISSRPDGIMEAEWVPAHKSDKIEYDHRGEVSGRTRRELRDEKDRFPVEVKTGEYAELERDQKEVLQGVAEADNRVHPIVINIRIDELPESYEVATRFI